ncbi:DUF4811 domain-containing protein [Lacticaseibacillus camelliae]|uniref:DUF4811 domain-containing protein n=1 Tax=Lacticaseibacillus camelliae DSM 22697 = JCM 13995 TaxID=1423730 RepID=A0A0R2EXM0_9LACO|nr:DUF4811 domain-containing protein [Lacticaseibacillus camelliae]KRN18677.1 hypothetical protein FC75_GL000445 [Lacticaseibacillus camelliae DSM 22697 = JCM 13995]
MILWILIISTALLFLSFMLMKNSWLRTLLSAIFLIILLSAIALIQNNDANHVGMKKVTTESTQVIYSASPSPQLKLLLHQDIGTAGKHNVVIYKTSEKGKATHTKADYDIHNKVVSTSDNVAQMKVRRTEWVYKSDFYSTLFANQNNHLLVSQTNTFSLPKGWYNLTTKQAKELGKQAKAMQNPSAAQKAAMGQAIQAQVAAAMQKNPSMSKADQQQLVKQITAKYQQQAMAKLINQIQAKY